LALDGAAGVVCANATADANKAADMRAKILFMLNLTVVENIPETIAIGCRTAADRVLLF